MRVTKGLCVTHNEGKNKCVTHKKQLNQKKKDIHDSWRYEKKKTLQKVFLSICDVLILLQIMYEMGSQLPSTMLRAGSHKPQF